jgi:hypothetical protein
MYKARIATIDEFRNSRDAWDKLALSMRYPVVFCTWEWIYTWWENFSEKKTLVIIFIYDETELKGILPLFAYKALFKGGWLTGRILSYCGATDVYPDHLDIICAGHDIEECMTAINRFLSMEYCAWDAIHVPLITEDSALAAWMRTGKSFFRVSLNQTSAAPYIPMAGDFERFIGGLDRKMRYNVRSRRKKLHEQHRFGYVKCAPYEEKEGLSILFNLHEMRANKKSIVSTFKGGHIRAFHDCLIDRICGNGWVSISLLRNETETIAASYNFVFGNRVFSYQKGSHPDWGQFGPGNIMLYGCINDAFSQGLEEYNLLHGNEAYKYDWTPHARPLLTAYIFNSTIGGWLSHSGLYIKQWLKHMVKAARKPAVVQQ